jgi:hypothetical protein
MLIQSVIYLIVELNSPEANYRGGMNTDKYIPCE